MKDVPITEVVQSAYHRAKADLEMGSLPITNIQDLCHVAHSYAFIDLYQGSKKPDQKKHYNKPIDELYKLFDKGTLSEKDTYASFAFWASFISRFTLLQFTNLKKHENAVSFDV